MDIDISTFLSASTLDTTAQPTDITRQMVTARPMTRSVNIVPRTPATEKP